MQSWLEKQRYIVDFTMSSLLRRKVKNIGLLVLYTLIVFILASIIFFTYAIKREAAFILQGSPEIIVQNLIAGRHDLLPVSFLDQIKSIRGVANVESRLWGYFYDSLVGANYTLLTPPSQAGSLNSDGKRTFVGSGGSDIPTPTEEKNLYECEGAPLEPGTLIIGNGVARMRSIGKGDYMPFMAADGEIMNLKIVNTLASESELVSSDLILMHELDFRKLFGISSTYVTDAIVTVSNPSEIETVANKIKKHIHTARPIIRDEILRTYSSIFNWRGGMMIVVFSAAVLAFVIFAWDKASGLSAEERQEIGILKAVGWETSDVIRMKFWEGALVSLTSFFSGVILAYIHVFFTGSIVFEPALKGWSNLYPNFKLTPFVNAEQLTTLFFLTVIPYTVATIVPIWRAATIDPDTAMRHTGN